MPEPDLPERDVAESMSALNVRRSYRSGTCPACGGMKECNSWMCEGCWAKVPGYVQSDLRQRCKRDAILEGKGRLLLVAFREMQLTRWHAPTRMVDAQWVDQRKGGSNGQRTV